MCGICQNGGTFKQHLLDKSRIECVVIIRKKAAHNWASEQYRKTDQTIYDAPPCQCLSRLKRRAISHFDAVGECTHRKQRELFDIYGRSVNTSQELDSCESYKQYR